MKATSTIGLAVGVILGAAGVISTLPAVAVNADCADTPCDHAPCCNGDVNGSGPPIDISDAIYLLTHLFLGGPGPVPIDFPDDPPCEPGLPSSGQTQCYDRLGNTIGCDDPAWPGQDGSERRGCPPEGRYETNGDGTVTDHCTGLVWQQRTAPGTYFWQQALLYCERLELGGETDWRLPNVRELHSIVDFGRADPAIDPVLESNSEWYWSSTTSPAFDPYACRVRFHHGNVGTDNKDVFHHVRAVRGGR